MDLTAMRPEELATVAQECAKINASLAHLILQYIRLIQGIDKFQRYSKLEVLTGTDKDVAIQTVS